MQEMSGSQLLKAITEITRDALQKINISHEVLNRLNSYRNIVQFKSVLRGKADKKIPESRR